MKTNILAYIQADGRQYSSVELFGLKNFYNIDERSLGDSKSITLSFMKEIEVSGVDTILSVNISIVNNYVFERDIKVLADYGTEDLFEDVVKEITDFVDYVATKDGKELYDESVYTFLDNFIKSLVYLRGYVKN